jgi:hypothetical protein
MHVAKQDPTKLVMGYKPYVKRHSFPRVRCSFWLLAWSNGCMYDCSYCWLKAYHPWPWTEIHIAEKPSITKTLRKFCKRIGGSQLLNAGELCDSFIAPEYISFMATKLHNYNLEFGRRHRLLLLTKSADPKVLLQSAYQDVVVYSVSVNTETMAKQLEHGAPSPNKRIHAAMRVKEAGYEVRVRVDPIIASSNPTGGFKSHPDSASGRQIHATHRDPRSNICYREDPLGVALPAGSEPAYVGLMERICSFIEPSLITLGSLRATPRTYRLLPDPIRAQLTERTPWGRGYPIETRLSFYNELIDVARRYGVPVALCKEAPDVWKRLGLRGPCNCMSTRG